MFRNEFKYSKKLFWRPGHQQQALEKLTRGIADIDLIIQIRDARIPFSSTTPSLQKAFGKRDTLIVYNKSDLANPNISNKLSKLSTSFNENSIFTSIHNDKTVKQILDFAIQKSKLNPTKFPSVSMVIVGLPNVGKSSLLNSLLRLGIQRKKLAPVAPFAGSTKKIQNKVKIYENPSIYLVDTPGIFEPHIIDPVQGLKVALCGNTKDSLVEAVHVADYLLFRMNQSENLRKRYAELYDVKQTDDITSLLQELASKNNWYLGGVEKSGTGKLKDVFNGLDVEFAAMNMITMFRKGKFGQMTLDDVDSEEFKRNMVEL